MLYKRYDYEKLFKLTQEVYIKYGYSEKDSKKIADVILTADRFGVESHGVNRFTLYPHGIDIGRIKVNVHPQIAKETPISAIIDAGDGMGQLAGIMGMELAIKKAKEIGVGMVAVRNSNHFGIAGYYSMMAAKQGLMGVAMTNAEPTVVPTFGRRPIMGTNPIAVTVPANPTFFHMDFATSVVTNGKMEVSAKQEVPIREGLLVDENGVVSIDPNKFLEIRRTKSMGGLMPLGGVGTDFSGHKGYGLGVLVDIMTGVFSHGAVSTGVRVVPEKDKCSHFFAALDYGIWGDKSEFEDQLSNYLQSIRDSEKAVGQDRIFTHGEKEKETEQDVILHGVKVNEVTLKEIYNCCEKLGINASDYLVASD